MNSETRIIANRANAQKSTGPRTTRGKSLARHNAVKFGMYAATDLLPGEDTKAHAELAADLLEYHKPEGPIEVEVVRQMFHALWRLRRLKEAARAAVKRVETELVLDEGMRGAGKVSISRDVDLAVREVLEAEDRGQPGEAGAAAESVKCRRKKARVFGNAKPPPTAYTFLLAFGLFEGGRYVDEIDRRTEVAVKGLLRLQAALYEMQDRRKTHTVIPVIISTDEARP